jgi:hypothetical protein
VWVTVIRISWQATRTFDVEVEITQITIVKERGIVRLATSITTFITPPPEIKGRTTSKQLPSDRRLFSTLLYRSSGVHDQSHEGTTSLSYTTQSRQPRGKVRGKWLELRYAMKMKGVQVFGIIQFS